jgi:hypothetical protein
MTLTTVAPGVGGTGLTAPGTSGNVLTSNGTAWTSGAPSGIAKAWVNFDGTGTLAIRGSFNVSSITDNGTGDYTVNFTTAMPNANYAANVTSNAVDNGGVIAIGMLQFYNSATNPMSTTNVRVKCGGTGGNNSPADAAFMCVSVFSS